MYGAGRNAVQECLFCHKTGHVSGNCPSRTAPTGSFSSMSSSGGAGASGGVPRTSIAADGSVTVQPIESLTPFVGNKWWIKARVTDKTPIRTWNNARSQGKLFSMTLVDNSGPIRATLFQEGVDRYFDMLTEGNVYLFSKGQVKTANKKFCSVNCEYELSFDKDADIQPVRVNDPSTQAFPQKVFSFVPLQSLKTREVGSNVDILCIVAGVRDSSNFTSKSGNNLTKRTISVTDHTAAIDITVWDQQAIQWQYPVGSLIGIKGARLGEFQGELSLSLSMGSSIEANPKCADYARLRKWYDENAATGVDAVPNLSKGSDTQRAPAQITRSVFDDVFRLGLGKGEKPDYLHVRMTATFIKTENMFYDACPDCNKKLVPTGIDGSGWRCEKCDKMKDVSDPRFLISMMVSDGSQSSWVTMFNDVAKKFFGVTAAEMKQEMRTNPNAATVICAPKVFFQFIGTVRVKEEKFAEGEDRMKLTVVNLRWLGPDGPVGESATSFVIESQLLIKDIEAYLAA